MTNQQLWIAVGLPVLTILASLIISVLQVVGIRTEIGNLRDDMRNLRVDVKDQISGVREDIREIRADVKILTGKVYEMMKSHE